MSKATLANVDRALLQLHLSEHGEPAYRAGRSGIGWPGVPPATRK